MPRPATRRCPAGPIATCGGNENGAFEARGIYGQAIYIDPKAEMVIVRYASHPYAANAANDPCHASGLCRGGEGVGIYDSR